MLIHILLFSCCIFNLNGQIANYVSNGGFEALNSNTTSTLYSVVKYWQPIDTGQASDYLVSTNPAINNSPNCTFGFQYPRSGQSFILTTLFCDGPACSPLNAVGNPRNRLKQHLEAGKTYCAKYYVVNTNYNKVAIANFGMYFGDSSLDTITYCCVPLSYLTPQVENTTGIITDTLNWIPITGTFVANGTEKYMVIGNFHNTANTTTLQLNTPAPTQGADIYIDDVSVIELNLPAYAGPDIYGIPTNTVYLGRPQDVGIDEACLWYHLPNTTTAIDTAAGITVTVASTTNTYMVKQDICGMIKYDTVVVYSSGVGMNELEKMKDRISIYPNPANNILNVDVQPQLISGIKILNNLGQIIREEELKNNSIDIKDLPSGIYFLNLISDKLGTVIKRFVVAR